MFRSCCLPWVGEVVMFGPAKIVTLVSACRAVTEQVRLRVLPSICERQAHGLPVVVGPLVVLLLRRGGCGERACILPLRQASNSNSGWTSNEFSSSGSSPSGRHPADFGRVT